MNRPAAAPALHSAPRAAGPDRPRLLARYRRLVFLAWFLTLDLIMFGAFVRLTDSGLGCPDWATAISAPWAPGTTSAPPWRPCPTARSAPSRPGSR